MLLDLKGQATSSSFSDTDSFVLKTKNQPLNKVSVALDRVRRFWEATIDRYKKQQQLVDKNILGEISRTLERLLSKKERERDN